MHFNKFDFKNTLMKFYYNETIKSVIKELICPSLIQFFFLFAFIKIGFFLVSLFHEYAWNMWRGWFFLSYLFLFIIFSLITNTIIFLFLKKNYFIILLIEIIKLGLLIIIFIDSILSMPNTYLLFFFCSIIVIFFYHFIINCIRHK